MDEIEEAFRKINSEKATGEDHTKFKMIKSIGEAGK